MTYCANIIGSLFYLLKKMFSLVTHLFFLDNSVTSLFDIFDEFPDSRGTSLFHTTCFDILMLYTKTTQELFNEFISFHSDINNTPENVINSNHYDIDQLQTFANCKQ